MLKIHKPNEAAGCYTANQINKIMDNKNNPGSPDRNTINLNEDYEVRYWTEELGVTKEELAEAVNKAGKSAQAVREFLGK